MINPVGQAKIPQIRDLAGNVITRERAVNFIAASVDGLLVCMGNGSMCITQEVWVVDRQQATAACAVAEFVRKLGIPVIADGGIGNVEHIVKAPALGVSITTMGRLLASMAKAPVSIFTMTGSVLKHERYG